MGIRSTYFDDTRWIDARPFRAQIAALLSETRLSWRVLAIALGLPAGIVRRLAQPSSQIQPLKKIRACDGSTLLAAKSGAIVAEARSLTDAQPAREVIDALLHRGYTLRDMMVATGIRERFLAQISAGQIRSCDTRTVWQLRAFAQCVHVEPEDLDSLSNTRFSLSGDLLAAA